MPYVTTTDGLSLYYTDTGSGIPVLCLSGLTRDHRDFSYVAPYLAPPNRDGLRMICMDYRGRGKSDWTDPATYTIPQEAQDAVTLMDHLGIDKAAILGTSRGGLIAMGLAAGARDRLLGVALNDIGPDIAPTGMEVIKTYIGRPPPWRTLAEAAAARPTVMAGFANVPASRWATEVAHFYTETPDGLTLSYDPGLRTAVLATTEQPLPDLWPFFEAIGDLPVCALRGANSDLLSAACFAEMQRRLPHMIATTIPDRGHVPFLDEPDALTALNRWLDQLA